MNYSPLPLYNIKVLELEGLAPTVFCGMILSDFGADVIIINRPEEPMMSVPSTNNFLNRGKRSIILNLKLAKHIVILKKLIAFSDVLIDPYRPGVIEKMGLGPEQCFKINKRIIICRVSGYGQTGPLALKAGHDINYLANSGVLGLFGSRKGVPMFPNNLLADFIGGGAMGAFGILAAVLERNKTGLGQVVDNSMAESALYLGSYILSLKRNGLWKSERGENVYDSGAPFYNIYQCKDGKYLTVAAVEGMSYSKFTKALNLKKEEENFCIENQFNKSKWIEIKNIVSQQILCKTCEEWNQIFSPLNVCVTPVVNLEELPQHFLHLDRKTIIMEKNLNDSMAKEFKYQIAPSPKFSSHPNFGEKIKKIPRSGENTLEILSELQLEGKNIEEYYKSLSLEVPKL